MFPPFDEHFDEHRLEDLLERGKESPFGTLMVRHVQQIQPAPAEPAAKIAIWAEVIRADHNRDYYSLGSFPAQELYTYGVALLGPLTKALQRIRGRIEDALAQPEDDLEFEHRCLLFWREIRRLSEFLGKSEEANEIIGAFLTAEATERANPTSRPKALALQRAIRLAAESTLLTTTVVDEVCDILEVAGFDLNAPLAAIPGDG